MISIFTFSKTLPVRKTTKNLTSNRLPYFRLTPPASFTLIGRVCHSSESFAKNEQRLLFSPTNLCQVRLVFWSILFFVFFPLSFFSLVFGFSLFSPKNNWLFLSSCLVWLLFFSHYTSHLPRYLLSFVQSVHRLT